MFLQYAVRPLKPRASYGCHVLDHLTADGTCLLGGEIAVVALLEVDTNLICCFHLKLVQSFLCFGYECLIGLGHDFFSFIQKNCNPGMSTSGIVYPRRLISVWNPFLWDSVVSMNAVLVGYE